MNRHIRILAGGKETALPDDFALDLELVNPLFNDNVESGSLPFNIPLRGNRHLVHNMEDVKSDVKVTDVEHTPCVVYVDDIPYHSGEIVVSEDQELKDSLDASINSYIRSLDDLIQDMECWDVPVKDKIQIGECLGDLWADYQFDLNVRMDSDEKYHFWGTPVGGGTAITDVLDLPAVGFSLPVVYKEKDAAHIDVEEENGERVVEEDFINTSEPYPYMPYCNARVCYEKKSYNDEATIDLKDPVYTLEARRPGSGICFYVMYFLDCLFDSMGLSYDNEKLLEVEDMRRLAFYTSHCEYDVERKYPDAEGYDITGLANINKWLENRSGGKNGNTSKLSVTDFPNDWSAAKSVSRVRMELVMANWGDAYRFEVDFPEGYVKDFAVGKWTDLSDSGTVLHSTGIIDSIKVAVAQVQDGSTMRANIMNMYANSKNFPETSVSNIIDSLWASFGIKFVLDSERRKVTPYYIRDVLRGSGSPRVLHGKVLSINKKAEKITGFRMRYAAESDPKDQSKNVRDGVRDYETAFNYLMSASPIVDDKHYDDLVMMNGGIADIKCYVDKRTGNAYRWKVDKEAKTVAEARVNLFEVAGYKGIAVGDCSKDVEDYVVDVTSNFEPLVLSDVNFSRVQEGSAEEETVMAAFADVDMLNEKSDCEITFATGTALVDFPIKAKILTDEKWDTSSSENGDSPLQHYDWGNSIAVMRGGGSDAHIQYYDYNYDGFGNAKYRTVSGAYAMTSDSMDNYGNQYDYVPDESDESDDDFGSGERFSLKITAYKHDEQGNPLTDDQGNILCGDDVRDAQGNIVTKIRSRGLYDTFMSPLAHFLLNRKVLVFRMKCEVAELVDIPNYWDERWQIDEYVGWINKVKTHVTKEAGLEEVEVEMYCL